MTEDEIKVICAWCKKYIRGDRNSTTVSHGICAKCEKEKIAEANDRGLISADSILNRMGGKQ